MRVTLHVLGGGVGCDLLPLMFVHICVTVDLMSPLREHGGVCCPHLAYAASLGHAWGTDPAANAFLVCGSEAA